MWRFTSLLLICLCLPDASISGRAQKTATLPARVFLLDANHLQKTKQRLHDNDPQLAPAWAKLEQDAKKALTIAPLSVTSKAVTPPSGDKHDYMSQAPYFWPDPKSPNGLPYIRRDGERNPEINKISDHRTMDEMVAATETLALAYYFKGEEAYAAKAAQLLRAWFLDAATRMNPHLEFAQGIPGINTGRGIGLIETRGLTRAVDAIGLLAGSKAWTEADQRGVQVWFSAFLKWMQESKHGRDENAAKNNHGTYYDIQAVSFALFLNQRELAKSILETAKQKRIALQIEPDGHQPLELARTKSWSYSTGNLDGLMLLARLGENVGVDLWNYQTPDGRGIRRALDYLVPFALGEKKWPDQQLGEWPPQMLYSHLRRAARQYNEPKYLAKVPEVAATERSHLLAPQNAAPKPAQGNAEAQDFTRWRYYRTLNFNTSATGAAVKGDVRNYPVAVALDARSLDFSQAKPDGADLRFTRAQNSQPLPHHIEHWDHARQTALVWVKLDVVRGDNMTQAIFMHWGNAEAANASDAKAVFDTKEGFVGVWHFNEEGNTAEGGYKDATANAADGTGVNMKPGTRGAGRLGAALELNYADKQWVKIDGPKRKLFDLTTRVTFSIWAKAKSYSNQGNKELNALPGYETMLAKGDNSWRLQKFGIRSWHKPPADLVEICVEKPPRADLCVVGKTDMTAGKWFHFTGVHDYPQAKLYVNGVLEAVETFDVNWKSDDFPVGFGNQSQFPEKGRWWDGWLDEARVLEVVKDEHWIKLDYESQREGQQFLTFGPTLDRTQKTQLAPLPGKGLAQHPFLYSGQWDTRKPQQTMYIIRDGKVAWSYSISDKDNYFVDSTLLSNGNIIFARKHGVTEITQAKKVVWNYDAPPGTEIHSAQPLGQDKVLFMQCGNPAKLILMNKKTGKAETELTLPTRRPENVHGQFRHVRMTKAGTFLVPHMDMGKVVEYDKTGRELWSVEAKSCWAAVRLKNGNTLISGNQHGYVREVNLQGEVVWEINKNDLPGITLHTVQEVSRLANGNTVICNWVGGVKKEDWPTVVQIIEVTPDKQVVWALREWTNPDLGPASSIQLLDQPGVAEKGDLQR